MKESKLNIIFAGGGTGGHVFPALNLAQAMERRWPINVMFFGTKRGLESRLAPKAGYTLTYLPVAGFHRRFTIKNVLFPFKLIVSLWICRRAIRQMQPQLVVGTGGYVMGPVLKTAAAKGIPMVIQEQNSYPGVTTRLLAKSAAVVFVAFEEAKNYLPENSRVVTAGNPVKIENVRDDREALYAFFGLDASMRTILVFGGSQGAENINRAIWRMLSTQGLPDGYQMLWQTGTKRIDHYRQKLREQPQPHVHVTPFIDAMPKAYKLAEFAVCRAGAMTISELMATGLPAVFVPLPTAAANHQFRNAETVAQKGGALVVKDDDRLEENLAASVFELASQPQKISRMAERIQAMYRGDAVKKILDTIEELPELRDWFRQWQREAPKERV